MTKLASRILGAFVAMTMLTFGTGFTRERQLQQQDASPDGITDRAPSRVRPVQAPFEDLHPTADLQSTWHDAADLPILGPEVAGTIVSLHHPDQVCRGDTLVGLRARSRGPSPTWTLSTTLRQRGASHDEAWVEARSSRVRGCGAALTEVFNSEFVLRTATGVHTTPAGGGRVARVLEVERRHPEVFQPAHLRLTLTLTPEPSGRCGRQPTGNTELHLEVPPESAHARFAVWISLPNPGDSAASPQLRHEPFSTAAATLVHDWRTPNRAITPTVYSTDSERLQDRIDAAAIDLLARDACSDLRLPIADQAGLLLAQLRFGLAEQAATGLRQLAHAVRRAGRVPLQISTHEALSADYAAPPNASWRDVEVVHSGALWIVLAHYWYWRATGDQALLRDHWALLEVCLKRTPRDAYDLVIDPLSPATRNFESCVLLGLATQMLGEMAGGLHQNQAEGRRVEHRYQQRMVEIFSSIERHFWCEDRAVFCSQAPSGVHGEISTTAACPPASPVAAWLGWTFASGDRISRHFESAEAQFARDHQLTTRRERCARLVAATHACLSSSRSRRSALLGDLLEPDLDSSEHLRSGDTSGFELDALLYACTGIRQACVPSLDREDVRLAPWLPREASRFAVRRHRKDGRLLDLSFDRRPHWMSLDEERAQASLPEFAPERDYNPLEVHQVVHFTCSAVTCLDDTPRWVQAAVRIGKTLHLRRLSTAGSAAGQTVEGYGYP